MVAFPLLLDTLYYVLDGRPTSFVLTYYSCLCWHSEIPTDAKATTLDPFRCYPTYELRSLPQDMPLEYRARIRALIPFVEPNLAVADLVYASTSKDALGASETTYVPVQNRPWEWTENLGEPAGTDMTKENMDSRSIHAAHHSTDQNVVVRNSASLSLDLFNARVIGKRAHLSDDLADAINEDARVDGTLRMLEDDLLSESIFRRDFRETRVDPSVADAKLSTRSAQDQDSLDSAGAAAGSDRHSSPRMGSPSSARSRGSMQPPSLPSGSGSRRASPATTLGSTSQPHPQSGLSKLAGSSV